MNRIYDLWTDSLRDLSIFFSKRFHNFKVRFFFNGVYYADFKDAIDVLFGVDKYLDLDYITLDLSNRDYLLIYFRESINSIINCERDSLDIIKDFVNAGIGKLFRYVNKDVFLSSISRTEIQQFECGFRLRTDIEEVPIALQRYIWKGNKRETLNLGFLREKEFKNFCCFIDNSFIDNYGEKFYEFEVKWGNNDKSSKYYRVIKSIDKLVDLINHFEKVYPKIKVIKNNPIKITKHKKSINYIFPSPVEIVLGKMGIRFITPFLIRKNRAIIYKPIGYNYGHPIGNFNDFDNKSYKKMEYGNYG